LENYALKIGERASLIPAKNERSYGVVMTVDKAQIKSLYAEPSVTDYIPEEVAIVTEMETIKAWCYNLPLESIRGINHAYAKSLYQLVERIGLPGVYVEKIRRIIN